MSENIATKFFNAQKELFEYVGFEPDWVQYAIDDATGCYWFIDGDDVIYADEIEHLSEENLETMEKDFYNDSVLTSKHVLLERRVLCGQIERDPNKEVKEFFKNEIYTQLFYDKWVYRGKDVTLIFCDPHVDGCKWFRIFDNKKEIKR